MTNKSHKLAVILQMRGTFVNLGINMHIFRYFPVKVFFILMCVVALMLPVSADPFSPNTQPDQISLTLTANSSASFPDSPVNSGNMISRDQNAGKKVSGVMVVPVKKEQNTLRISNGQSNHKIGKIQILKGTLPKTRKSSETSTINANNLPSIEILDQNNTVIYTKKFSYQNTMTVPMKPPGQADDQVPPVISTSSETTIVIPYQEGGRKIRIVDENGQAGSVVPLDDSQITDQVSGNLDQLHPISRQQTRDRLMFSFLPADIPPPPSAVLIPRLAC